MIRETDKTKLQEYCSQNPNGLSPEQLDKICAEMEHPKEMTITDEYLDFTLWCRGMPSRQESFAAYIEKEFPATKGKRILEVGGGIHGRLSLLLAEKGYRMTCMDPELELDGDGNEYRSLPDRSRNLSHSDSQTGAKVEFRKELFDYRAVDLSGYDCVVGQEPCEASEHIVRACTIQSVPFMVLLCGVPHRLISGELPDDVWAWYRYLREIDPEHTVMELVDLYGLVNTAMIRSKKDIFEQ